MIKLLPCPFCTAPAYSFIYDDHDMREWHSRKCGNEECPADELIIQALTPREADAKWNTRAPQAIRIPFSFFSEAEREMIQAANPGKIIEDVA